MNSMSLIDAFGLFGVVVFAVSGALAAGRYHMDPIGFLLLGTVTAVGGGTMRDLILDRPVFWVVDDQQLMIALVSSALVYLFVRKDISRQHWLVWSDALGLSAFAVQGTFIAIQTQVSAVVVVVFGMMTAVGGGVIRDILSGQRPMIFEGQLYASTAMLGSIVVVMMNHYALDNNISAAAGFITVFMVRGLAIKTDVRIVSPADFFRTRR